MLGVRQRLLGADHPLTLASLDNRAKVLRMLGRHDEAVRLHREAMEGLRQALGPQHLVTLYSMSNLATALHTQGQGLEASEIRLVQQCTSFIVFWGSGFSYIRQVVPKKYVLLSLWGGSTENLRSCIFRFYKAGASSWERTTT